jgi:hypothetical protein
MAKKEKSIINRIDLSDINFIFSFYTISFKQLHILCDGHKTKGREKTILNMLLL